MLITGMPCAITRMFRTRSVKWQPSYIRRRRAEAGRKKNSWFCAADVPPSMTNLCDDGSFSIKCCSFVKLNHGEHTFGNHEDNRHRRDWRATQANQDDCRCRAFRQPTAPKLWRQRIYAKPWLQDHSGQSVD